MREQDTERSNVVSLTDKLDAPLVANVTPEVTDIARLRDAFDRLEEAGFVVLDGGCCSPEIFVMEPTDAWHLHHPALARRLRARGSGASLASDKCVAPAEFSESTTR